MGYRLDLKERSNKGMMKGKEKNKCFFFFFKSSRSRNQIPVDSKEEERAWVNTRKGTHVTVRTGAPTEGKTKGKPCRMGH